MYKTVIRPLLFLLSPEKAHHLATSMLVVFCRIPGVKWLLRQFLNYQDPNLKRELFGLTFPNPVGLAAGFDKEAQFIDEFAALGFGFIEIGTITPKGQPGNPKPRLFRLPQDHALINRMGFNNLGVDMAVRQLKKRRTGVIVGGNIGKNKLTPNEEAYRDYEICFDALFNYVDYFVVNVSSPNTPNLRALQEKEPLKQLLRTLVNKNRTKITPKPILLKIAPDLSDPQLDDIIEIVEELHLDGVVATNTTISRESLTTNTDTLDQIGSGGLSGKPLKDRSTEVIQYLRKHSKTNFPIIGVGGISSPDDALEKINAGASLVQLYTGFIYEGPGLVKEINKTLAKVNFG